MPKRQNVSSRFNALSDEIKIYIFSPRLRKIIYLQQSLVTLQKHSVKLPLLKCKNVCIANWNCFASPLVLDTSFKTTHLEHGSMKKTRKTSAGKNRRQKGNGQARLKTDNNNLSVGVDRLSTSHEAKPRDPNAPHPGTNRKPRGTDEQKRKLWERKQAELEARRAAAEARQREEEAERRRKTRVAGSILGAVTVTLAGALTWYFA
ncbi:hypothetical protein ACFQUU_12870 [Herbaspirillum sp. GCM10030257]|uniref:hypothetical protein n=1 Tax=Herbaspirillum sp. GCM10030257 TaxID=3273393 RepID=UPI00361CDA68